MTRRRLSLGAGGVLLGAVLLVAPGREAGAHDCVQVEVSFPTSTTIGDCQVHDPMTHMCRVTSLGVTRVTECTELI